MSTPPHGLVEPSKEKIRWLRLGVRLLIGIALLLIALLVYLSTSDLSRIKGAVERAITSATGRQLTIDGRFELDIGRTTRLVATDINFANPDWSREPTMVSVGHLAVAMDLWSLLSRPIVVHDLEIGGVRVALERDSEGRPNWELDLSGEPDGSDEPLQLILEHLEIRDLELRYQDETSSRTTTAVLDTLAARRNETGFMSLDVKGSLNDRPLELAGKVGTFDDLLADENVRLEWSGRVGVLELELQGQVGELATLKRPDLVLEIHADEAATVTEMLGLASPGPGGLHVSGRLSPASSGVTLDFAIELADVRATLTGTVDDLLDTTVADVSVEASGPDLTLLSSLIEGLPEGAFEIAGHVRQEGATYSLDRVEVKLGSSEAKIHGTLGEVPALTGASLEFEAGGQDLSVFSTLAGIKLPSRAFIARGRLDSTPEGLKLDGVRAEIGENLLTLDGVLGASPKFVGSSLLIHARGPDVRVIPGVSSLGNLPAEAFDLEGRLNVNLEDFEIAELHATVGDLDLRAEGVVGRAPGLDGTDLQIEARGPDLNRLTPYTGLEALPAEPYSVSGQLRLQHSRYLVDGLVVQVGSGRIELSGEVGASSDLVGTALDYEASIPDLAIFDVMFSKLRLPGESLTSNGRVRVDETGYALEGVQAQLGDATLSVDGVVGRAAGLTGTVLTFDASAPDLTLVQPFVESVQLPTQRVSAAGNLRIVEDGYVLSETTVHLGGNVLDLEGTVGRPPKLIGTDITFEAAGSDFAEIAAIMGRTAPSEPFSLAGRLERFEQGLRLHDVSARVGAHKVHVSGLVGEPPKLVGTDLGFTVEGPNLQLIAQLAGLEMDFAADESFATTGHFLDTPEALQLKDFTARLGESDLSGTFDVDLRNKPDLKGQFTSRFLDLSAFLGKPEAVPSAETTNPEPTHVEPTPGEMRYLIPDTPLAVSALDAANLDIRFSGQKVHLKGAELSNVELGLHLRDRALRLDPISAAGDQMGSVSATFALTPFGDGFDVAMEGDATQMRIGMLAAHAADRSQQPPLDVSFRFEGRGSSLHAIAASGNGFVESVQGNGRIDNSALSLLTSSVVKQVFDAINPFRKEEPHTAFDCGVYAVTIVDGIATLDPLVARTDKMRVVGSGLIDLRTESLTLEWKTKPRRGLGLSLSSLTNPYIRLGGTLSHPVIGFKPSEATVTTGVAVATGGISILASGFYDRLMADEDICGTARERLKGDLAGEGPARRPPP